MILKGFFSATLIFLFFFAGLAQEQEQVLKITDLEGNTTLVSEASSSSSTSCNSPDFPALRGGSRKDINFGELTWITVLHHKPANDPESYVKVELTFKDGVSEEYEMIKYVRFTGKAGQENFSIQVKDINTVQVLSR